MQKLRTERGITLIALIITIIVMLILVGVSVTVALNGGLFTTAKEATNKTQLEIDKEQLLELALGAIDNKGNVDSAKITADGRFTYADGVYTSKSGNRFTVSKWGSVAIAPETPVNPGPDETVYELSGEWQFNRDMGEKYSETTTTISQTIDFIVDDTENYTEMSFRISAASGASYSDYHVYYNDTMAYSGETYVWNDSYTYDFSLVDFGTEPQEVSEEFYEWFTANANPVTE